ncbi:hypothetical protein SAMN05216214_1151 [Atopomonas hussainii]|uniref:Uncharacterized protein n=1 Tax=Atopomonas hussainii TaxID=1429083 RepID=A0A1H7RIQ1_9GAMM|nr:hypothetical protein SAMN05216214_1151 [Atopomonas hussainii]
MKKHQIVAIVVGLSLSVVSFLPVFITASSGFALGHPSVVKVFFYPTIGVAVSAILVFVAFFMGSKGE